MEWVREAEESYAEKWLLSLLLVMFFLVSVLKLYLAAAILMFAGILIGMQAAYTNRAGSRLTLTDRRIRKRMLRGGKSEWELEFTNSGLPIWGARLKLYFPDIVEPGAGGLRHYGDIIEVAIPFTAGYRKKTTVKIPVMGKRRGVAKIQAMELLIPHPFGDGQSLLKYGKPVRQELLVYPTIYRLPAERAASKLKPGMMDVKDSLFDDLFQPVGTRDYTPADQFHHIHWKASARLDRLQTKVFSKTADESVLFVADVAAKYSTVAHLEERIEELASLIDRSAAEGLAFSVAVNVRSAGKTPYLYLPEGSGQKQRQRALELLAVVSKDDSVIPLRSVLAHLDFHVELPVTTVLLTDDTEQVSHFIAKWSRQTHLRIRTADRDRRLVQ
ncbi:DUF58 domain-containing protein [Indiicoccus explosivorum]|uniref:DUF58 domain-containing protein n=1 Tax=Indiicoccus explosivorum TaxID=1917864 RepID=UPI000B4314C1|nr:DUF58 domain-containing protein [Indiicoccus explosivorum]